MIFGFLKLFGVHRQNIKNASQEVFDKSKGARWKFMKYAKLLNRIIFKRNMA